MTIKYQLQHFLKFDKDIPAQHLTVDYCQKYIEYMRNSKLNGIKDYSEATIFSSLDFLKASVNQGIRNKKIIRNHNIEEFLSFRLLLKNTEYKLELNQRDDTFTDEKLEKVIENCESKDMVLMLKITSRYPTRFSELRQLRLDAFEVRNNKGFLSFKDVFKKGAKRDIGIADELTQELSKVKESKVNGEVYFFTDKSGELLKASVLRNDLDKARNKSGVKEVFHQLRQKSTTNCFRAGLDMKIIQILGGWKSEKMVLRYYKPKDVDLEKVGDVIENYRKSAYGK